MIRLKSEEEIKIMREAGKIVAETHELLKSAIIPGVSTLELDTIAEENIRKYNAVPSFKGYGDLKEAFVHLSTMRLYMGFLETK